LLLPKQETKIIHQYNEWFSLTLITPLPNKNTGFVVWNALTAFVVENWIVFPRWNIS
jgi:hypothetical protein